MPRRSHTRGWDRFSRQPTASQPGLQNRNGGYSASLINWSCL